AKLIAEAKEPAPQLSNWIDHASERHPIPSDATGAERIETSETTASAKPQAAKQSISLSNGQIVCNGAPITGSRQEVMWWRGGMRPKDLAQNTPCITRWVPGRYGTGLTDDLTELTDSMLANHIAAMEHHYALWYDRRNDDHERVRRMNGDAWAPFLELPFARSGQGVAW